MKKAILALAVLAFSAPVAGACEYMRSAQAKVDKTVVASIAQEKSVPMSTADQTAPKEAAPAQDGDQY